MPLTFVHEGRVVGSMSFEDSKVPERPGEGIATIRDARGQVVETQPFMLTLDRY